VSEPPEIITDTLMAHTPSAPEIVSYRPVVAPFARCGLGMALFFIPVANVVIGAVPGDDEGVASGTDNAIRELVGCSG
jgi:hypothetical protein